MALELNDIVVYANGQRDQIVGFPKVNGAKSLLVHPMDGRKAWSSSDALKSMQWIIDMVKAGVFKIVKPIDGVDPETGVFLETHRGRRIAALGVAHVVMGEVVEEARAKHGTEDLSMFRDEWELHRRLESMIRSVEAEA